MGWTFAETSLSAISTSYWTPKICPSGFLHGRNLATGGSRAPTQRGQQISKKKGKLNEVHKTIQCSGVNRRCLGGHSKRLLRPKFSKCRGDYRPGYAKHCPLYGRCSLGDYNGQNQDRHER